MLRVLIISLPILISTPIFAQTCPGSEEVEADISLNYNGDNRLFICGFEEKTQNPLKGKRQFSHFSIYYETNTDQPKKLFSAAAIDHFWIKVDKKARTIGLEELVWAVDRNIPIFNSEIKCGTTGCLKTGEKCSVPRGKGKTPEIVKQIDKKIRGKFTKIHEPMDVMIQMALAQALAGDKSARDFFKSSQVPDKLDPTSVQQFLDSQKIIERLNVAGCFKK